MIGLFKLVKAFFLLMGVGAIHLLHRDLGDEVMRLATAAEFDPESRLVTMLLDKAGPDRCAPAEADWLRHFLFGAGVTEGVGLVLEKVWAEYLTLSVTVRFCRGSCMRCAAAGLVAVEPAAGQPGGAGVPAVVAATEEVAAAARRVS